MSHYVSKYIKKETINSKYFNTKFLVCLINDKVVQCYLSKRIYEKSNITEEMKKEYDHGKKHYKLFDIRFNELELQNLDVLNEIQVYCYKKSYPTKLELYEHPYLYDKNDFNYSKATLLETLNIDITSYDLSKVVFYNTKISSNSKIQNYICMQINDTLSTSRGINDKIEYNFILDIIFTTSYVRTNLYMCNHCGNYNSYYKVNQIIDIKLKDIHDIYLKSMILKFK